MLVQVSPQGFPQMAATARAELGHRQEQGTPSGSATCVAGAQRLELSSTAFPGTLAGSWIRNSSWNLTGTLVLFLSSYEREREMEEGLSRWFTP